MRYNNDWAKALFDEGERLKFLFFWGHRPCKDGVITKSCFSQWFERGFVYEDITYLTAEHWMMAEKARLFEDAATLQKIINCTSADVAKKLGREVKNFDEKTWMDNREDIVIFGNELKFSQHEDLKEFLLKTGDKIIVEASPYDKIWGIGMRQEDEGIDNPHQWQGLNLLGYALMEVRDRLRD